MFVVSVCMCVLSSVVTVTLHKRLTVDLELA